MACVIGQNPSAQVAAEPEPSAARLEFIKAVAGRYKIYVGQDPRRRPLVLRETPVLRFGDDVTGVSDGAVFIWTDWVQRPPPPVRANPLADRAGQEGDHLLELLRKPLTADSSTTRKAV